MSIFIILIIRILYIIRAFICLASKAAMEPGKVYRKQKGSTFEAD